MRILSHRRSIDLTLIWAGFIIDIKINLPNTVTNTPLLATSKHDVRAKSIVVAVMYKLFCDFINV